MTLNIEMEYETPLDFDYEELAKKVTEAALDYENCPYEAEINLVLTGNEEIQRTNREFREIDRITDVLSFPMLDFETPADFSHAEEDASCFHRGYRGAFAGRYYDLCSQNAGAGRKLWTRTGAGVCLSHCSQYAASYGI